MSNNKSINRMGEGDQKLIMTVGCVLTSEYTILYPSPLLQDKNNVCFVIQEGVEPTNDTREVWRQWQFDTRIFTMSHYYLAMTQNNYWTLVNSISQLNCSEIQVKWIYIVLIQMLMLLSKTLWAIKLRKLWLYEETRKICDSSYFWWRNKWWLRLFS